MIKNKCTLWSESRHILSQAVAHIEEAQNSEDVSPQFKQGRREKAIMQKAAIPYKILVHASGKIGNFRRIFVVVISSELRKTQFKKKVKSKSWCQIPCWGGCFLNVIDVEEERNLNKVRNRTPVARGRTNLGAAQKK